MSQTQTRWKPLGSYDWGEGTAQARAQRDDPDEESAPEWWTDAYEIRMRFGIPQFDPEAFDYEIYPDLLIHEDPAAETTSAGGTAWIAYGERGSGKTTNNLQWSERLMEVNDETVIWRGSPLRSEWLPFKDWATVWLPDGAGVEPGWKSGGTLDEDGLEKLARDVRYYDDVRDLVDELGAHPGGTFNVVYPDPSFAGCSELVSQTDRVSKELAWVPKWEAIEGEGTPLTHWWFAFVLGAVDYSPRQWWSLIFDEAGDLAEEGAEEDENNTYTKVQLLRSCMSDSRRAWFSVYMSAHYEENLHHWIRREFNNWIDMPDGTPNPRKRRSRTHPLGAKTVPMYADIMSSRKVGTGLMFNQSEFTLYRWKDLPIERVASEFENHVLQISLVEPEREDEEETGTTLQYDPSVFKRWRAPDEDRLYVKDPGEGYLDVYTGTEVEPLSSPRAGWEFAGVALEDDLAEVTMREADADDPDEIVVAQIPISEFGLGLDDESSDADENRGATA